MILYDKNKKKVAEKTKSTGQNQLTFRDVKLVRMLTYGKTDYPVPAAVNEYLQNPYK